MCTNKSLRVIGVFILLFVVVVAFAGCGGGTAPPNDETKISDVIYEFCLSMSNQDWDTARNYCVYGSEAYEFVDVTEEIFNLDNIYHEGTLDIDFSGSIDQITITGEVAEVWVDVFVTVITNGNPMDEFNKYDGESVWELEKNNYNWKLIDLGMGLVPPSKVENALFELKAEPGIVIDNDSVSIEMQFTRSNVPDLLSEIILCNILLDDLIVESNLDYDILPFGFQCVLNKEKEFYLRISGKAKYEKVFLNVSQLMCYKLFFTCAVFDLYEVTAE